jgi:hypothetical protein
MTDRPLILSDESVRGILAGTKTMTQRLMGKNPVKWAVGDRIWVKEAWAIYDLLLAITFRRINA